jgi:signal transduction histidine kinase/CheY-like chemotaxis protein
MWLVITLPLAYFASAIFAISAFGANPPIWVSNALVVAALLRHQRSTWPVLLTLAMVAGCAANAYAGAPIVGVGLSFFNVAEVLLVAVLSSASGAVWLGQDIRQHARFILVCLLAPTLSATGGAGLLSLVDGAAFPAGWMVWYLSNASGLLIVAPLLLSWTEPTLRRDRFGPLAGQAVVLAGLVATIGYLLCHAEISGLYLAFPFLLLATFTGRLLGATTAAAFLSGVVIWSTLQGHGPIAAYAGPSAVLQAQLLQVFIASVLLSTLPVAAFLEQRETLMAQWRAATRTAQAAARAKSAFMAVMSHEVRTPMTGVLGLADLLLTADLPAKEREYVAGIQRSGRHLLVRINDILDASRGEANKLDLETVDFDLSDVLEQVRSLLGPQAAERGLDLRLDDVSGLPAVLRGDPTRLKQVLVHLVGNGLKFTPEGGVTVTIGQRMADDGRERFRCEVRDTGIGIAKEQQTILFNAFTQIDASPPRHHGGSGLGLAISKKLVEAMGGEIGVASAPGAGSLFWFEVPLERGSSASPQGEQRNAVASPPRRVLLVEDVELNRVLIADMLRAHGHEVATAAHGREAVALAARERFDLVLMDVQMPVMDGVEATRQIRKLPPPAAAVPILALSANVLPEDRARYLAAGMSGALAKPIDWPQLFAALAKYGRAAALFDRARPVQGEPLSPQWAEIFLRDTARRLEELRDAVQRGDATALVRVAALHSAFKRGEADGATSGSTGDQR